ncbi:MAG TPA: hypothetical protein VEW07_11925, partial [Solirubrobacterales bacterium]|nr:hypothetical protein [Solirubrobacterales bacterium]
GAALLLLLLLLLGSSSARAAVDPCPNAEFRKGLGAFLPGCRAYEKVSPNDKGGFDIGQTPSFSGPQASAPGTGLDDGNRADIDPLNAGPATVDGSRVAYFGQGSFAGATSGGIVMQQYVAVRQNAGWQTTPILPRFTSRFTVYGARPSLLSGDLSRSYLGAVSAVLEGDPDGDPAAANLYLRDNFSGAVERIATAPSVQYPAGSSDLGRVVFGSSEVLTAEPGQPELADKVYEYSSGQLRLLSRRPVDDTPFQGAAAVGGSERSHDGAVSADGRYVYFTATDGPPGSATGIYRRGAGVTELATPSKRTLPDPDVAAAKNFKVATPDGNRLFFTSAVNLTDDANPAGEDLYRYDFDADRMVDLSAGTVGTEAAGVLGVLDISDSGDRAYFVASGQVVPGQGVPGQPNLFLWQDDGTAQGAVRFLATLSPDDAADWGRGPVASQRTAQATPDAEQLVFASRGNLTGFDPLGTRQLYRYDVGAGSGGGGLACISCASPPAGSSLLPLTGIFVGSSLPRAISDDGRRVLFSSPQPLLARDGNGVWDAYLWEDGKLFLLSSGSDGTDSFAWSMGADGEDLFFRARSRLVPSDVDTLADLYVARVGGGLESQQATPLPSCDGEGCQPSTPPPSAGAGVLSALSGGSGNLKEKRRKVRRCHKGERRAKSPRGKVRCVKTKQAHAGRRGQGAKR